MRRFAWASQLRIQLLIGLVAVILASAVSIDVAVQRTLSRELPQVELQSLAYQARRLQSGLEAVYADHGSLSSKLLSEPSYLPLRIYRADGSLVESTSWLPPEDTVEPVRQARQDQPAQVVALHANDQRFGYVVLPLHHAGRIVGVVEVAQELRPITGFQETIRRDLARTTILALSAVVAFCVFLGMRFSTALDHIKGQTAAMIGGNFDRRMPVRSKDEIGQIATYLNHMAESLQRLTKTRNEFLSKVSHELRTPLTIAQGFSSMLRQGELLPGQERTVTIIDEQIAELTRLVNDLLDLSRREHSALDLHPAPIDCAELVGEVLEQHRPIMEGAELALKTRVRHNAVFISGDRQRLHQVLGNLIGNAARYSRGRIELGLQAEGGSVLLQVRDDGPGIAPADLSRIFEPFCQLPGSAPGRAGLGLTVVRELVDAHGGTITVESTLGQGTCFTIRLPRATAPAQRGALAARRWRPPAEGTADAAPQPETAAALDVRPASR